MWPESGFHLVSSFIASDVKPPAVLHPVERGCRKQLSESYNLSPVLSIAWRAVGGFKYNDIKIESLARGVMFFGRYVRILDESRGISETSSSTLQC